KQALVRRLRRQCADGGRQQQRQRRHKRSGRRLREVIAMTQRSKKRLRSRGGNAMVEFALASSLLIPIFLGTFQFGYTFYVYNLLSSQMRAGSRYASMKSYKCADAASVSNFKQ